MAIERILVADPDKNVREFLHTALSDWDCQISLAGDAVEALSWAQARPYDLLLAAPEVAGAQWSVWVDQLRQLSPDLLVVSVRSGAPGAKALAEQGADAFSVLSKPLSREELFVLLERAERHVALLAATRHLAEEQRQAALPLVAFSPRMRQLIAEAQRAAWSDSPVLIRGEIGTEKAALAHFVHDHSPVAGGLFLACDFAVASEEIESRLFGCERAAPSGRRHCGLIELAAGGTLFIRRIEYCPEPVQGKLLRLLEENTYERLDGARELTCEARIVVSTTHDPHEGIQSGRIRTDLFFRFGPAFLDLPALRERPDDLPALVAALVRQLGASPELITPDLLDRLRAYAWPGNAGELRAVLEAALLRGGGKALPLDALTLPVREPSAAPARIAPLAEVEREHLRLALEHARGDKAQAARWLGISMHSLGTRIRQCGLAGELLAARSHKRLGHKIPNDRVFSNR